ncbi:hypothetical protein AAIB33_01930 [Microbacterium sp. AZCO]|uniref:hypothetical protein n=1 Tax=Microbacterium sp. AZCO TaxID=3142976 RepID=UPI0031F472B0
MPIAIVLAWWVIGLFFYLAGWPVPYRRVNAGLVAALVSASAVLAGCAYLVVSRRAPAGVIPNRSRRAPVIVVVGIFASVLLLFPWAETYSAFHAWELLGALQDQGRAFLGSSERIDQGSGSRLLVIAAQVLAAPATMAVIPFTALAWFERRAHGVYLLAGLSVQAAMSILVGRDTYVVSAGILCAAGWYVARVRRASMPGWRAVLIIAAGTVLFLVVFGARKLSRGVREQLCLPGADRCVTDGPPTLWDSVAASFVTYSSQSMEGLGRAFLGNWAFGGGYRHSQALGGIVKTLMGGGGPDVITDQLTAHDWSDTAYWSTGFAWIANDVPWILVPVFVAIAAAFVALAWRRVVRWGDWLSASVFGYGWFALFFLAQNLTLATSGPLYVGYIVLAVLFLAREVRLVLRRVARRAPTPAAK